MESDFLFSNCLLVSSFAKLWISRICLAKLLAKSFSLEHWKLIKFGVPYQF